MSEKDKPQQKPMRHGGPAFARPVVKAKNFKGSFVRLAKYLSPFKWRLLIVLITAIFSTVFSIRGPKIIGDGFNKVLEGLTSLQSGASTTFTIDYQYLFKNIILLLIGLYLISAAFSYLQQYIMATVSQKTVYKLRKDVNNKLSKLPLKYFDSKTHGEILSRITNDIDMIASTLSQSITQIITSVVMLVGITWMMFTLSWLLTLIVLATLPLSIAISIPILKAAQKFFKGQQAALGQLSGHVEEMYTGHKIVKAFGREEKSIKTFEGINEKLYQSGWKAQFITGIIMPIMTFVNNIGYVFVSIVGVSLVIQGKLKIGYISTFISYTRQFQQPISQTASISNTLQLTVAAAERVFELLDADEMEVETSQPTILLTDKGYVIPRNQYNVTENTKLISTDLGLAIVDEKMVTEDMEFIEINDETTAEIIGKIVQNPDRVREEMVEIEMLSSNKGYIIPNQEFNMNQSSKVIKTNQGYVLVDKDLQEENLDYVEVDDDIRDNLFGKLISFPKGYIDFTQVDFRYNQETPLIDDMNINVKPGQTIAIVGPTGAGKTTIVNLLMRFYEINNGAIMVDGVNIRDLKRDDLRQVFGMVLQDTWMFNGTIKDNIAYGRMDATDEEIIASAKAAEADHFIRTLPEGYNTVLNEEASNISQGQKQLLTIARALLANPPVLILDEATSSVDTRTEIHIQNAMTLLMKGRTNFVIAHRLSTIKNADLILVMNHGKIIEQGNHETLLEKNGFYADLYNSQFTKNNTEIA